MPPREWRFRVEDMLEAIDQIVSYTAGSDLETLRGDREKVDAILYRFIVLGEAANGIPEAIRDRHPGVPWAEIRAFRNVMVHDYAGVRVEIVWKTLRDDLEPIRPLLKAMIEE